jgi:hypothetical protein
VEQIGKEKFNGEIKNMHKISVGNLEKKDTLGELSINEMLKTM